MGLNRTPVLTGALLFAAAGSVACGGGSQQLKMAMLQVQAMPPAQQEQASIAPPPPRFDPPPEDRFEPPPPPPPPVEEVSNSMVELRGERIEIREKVQFETWQSDLRGSSFRLLDQIADLLKRNSQVRKVEIQGHTSITKRNRERLQPLSQRRANAVRSYLIEQGVRPERLVARGYGYKRPIADNRTPEGREANRRVEFVILEQGSAGFSSARREPAVPAPPPPASSGGDLDDFEEEEDFDDDFEDDFEDDDDF